MNTYPAFVWRNNTKRRKYLGEVGVVESFSIVRQSMGKLEKRTPYVLAIIQIGEKKTTAQMVGVAVEEIEIGMKVMGVLRRMYDVSKEDLMVYGVKFSPLRGENSSK